MKRRVRHHVNPANIAFRLRDVRPVPLPEDMPVEVELGCADARFLFELAPHHPDRYYVGLEIREPLVEQVNAQARQLGFANLHAHFAHVNVDLPALFPDGRLARVYVNFPDPWFKRRHHGRRVMTPELAELLFRKIEPGGELFFQSDIWDLALEAMTVLEASPFRNRLAPWSFLRDNPYEAQSLRELRCEERGLRIWRMRYDRPA
jgi:tRNA (guanine-N7-)-methyltransferase